MAIDSISALTITYLMFYLPDRIPLPSLRLFDVEHFSRQVLCYITLCSPNMYNLPLPPEIYMASLPFFLLF